MKYGLIREELILFMVWAVVMTPVLQFQLTRMPEIKFQFDYFIRKMNITTMRQMWVEKELSM